MSVPHRVSSVAAAAVVVCGLVALCGLVAGCGGSLRDGTVRGGSARDGSARGGSAPGGSSRTATPVVDRAPCTAPTGVAQSATGRVDACIQIGAVAPGAYTVVLQDTFEFGELLAIMRTKVQAVTGAGGTVPASLRRELRQAAVPQPHVELTLTPASGPPGTSVRVAGTLRAPATHRGRSVQLCWDGCRRGLDLSGARGVRWTSRRTFVERVRVPDAPWLEGGVDRVIPLAGGSYPIDVTCVTGKASCMLAAGPEGSAEFKLQDTAAPGWCRTSSSCATLRVWPRSAPPGALVRISGYAPLIEWDDVAPLQFGGNVAVLPGHRTGKRVTITPDGTQVGVQIGNGAVRVSSSPHFASLAPVHPRYIATSGMTPLAAAPTDSRLVAWCGRGSISVSDHGRVRHVSTAGVSEVLRGLNVSPEGRQEPRCQDVMPLSTSTMLAAFGGGLKPYGAPPVYEFALETRDGGRNWKPLPAPPGSAPAGFGGFRAAGREVQAIYARRVKGRDEPDFDAARPLAEDSADAGASWTPGRLACPAPGPCVTFGPYLQVNCAMGFATQFVLRSTDGGRAWRRSPIFDYGQLACGDAHLVATGKRSELLVNALSTYAMQRSTDSGANWRSLSLPLPDSLQGTASEGLGDFGPGGFTVLAGGALLLTGGGTYKGGWQLLTPGAKRWCEVAGRHASWQFAPQASVITPIGAELWWLTYGTSPGNGRPAPIHVHHLPLSGARCA